MAISWFGDGVRIASVALSACGLPAVRELCDADSVTGDAQDEQAAYERRPPVRH
jgi:hypothetical protein